MSINEKVKRYKLILANFNSCSRFVVVLRVLFKTKSIELRSKCETIEVMR